MSLENFNDPRLNINDPRLVELTLVKILQEITKMRIEGKEILTFPEACEYLRISAGTLYKLTSRKLIPGSKPGRRWLFMRSQLQAWLVSKSSG